MKKIMISIYILICVTLSGMEPSIDIGIPEKKTTDFRGIQAYFDRITYLQPTIEEIYLLGFNEGETDKLKGDFPGIEFSSFSMEKDAGKLWETRALVVKERKETSYLEKLNYPVYGYKYTPSDEFTMVLYPYEEKAVNSEEESLFFNYPKAKQYKLNYFLLEGGYSFYNMNGHFFVIDKRSLNKIIISFHLTIIVSFMMFYLIISRRKLVKELTKTRLIAEEASLEKGRFLANMSHEIRTPLSGIIGTVETLKGLSMDRKVSTKVGVIEGASLHLLEVINDILDFSKIEANKIEINESQFSLRETLGEVLQIFESVVNSKELKLRCNCSKDVPYFVVGDRLAIRKVLINLVGNSVKFTQSGEINLDVEINSLGELHFKVSDSGIGISEEILDKITGDFIQGQQGDSREYEGTGLGLAITSRFLSLMGSELLVESVIGVGSTFHFKVTLPKGEGKIEHIDRGFILYTASQEIREFFQTFGDDYGHSYIITGNEEEFRDLSGDEDLLLEYSHIFIGEDMYSPEKHVMEATVVCSSPTELEKASVLCMNPLFNWKIHTSMEKVCFEQPEKRIKNIKALIIDDSKLNLNVLKELLEGIGVSVTWALRGLEALELLTDETDIVFTDIQMPEMDGYELARRVKEKNKKLPVVAITANAFLEDRIKALRGNLDAYVTKPFQRNDLIEVIEDLIPHLKVKNLFCKFGNEGIIADCLKEIPEGLYELRKAIEVRSYEKVRYYAHKLKGEFSYLKEDKIGILLEEIERDSEDLKEKAEYLKVIEVRWKSLQERIGEEYEYINSRG